MLIEVYADGSATTGDKAGGWGSVIIVDGVLHKELSGHLDSATNNDAELIAAIQGLDYVHKEVKIVDNSYQVNLISDSQIVLNWANGTYRFKQMDKIHHYDRIRLLVKEMKVTTRWVKGHSGDVWNTRCDKLANNARKGIQTDAAERVVSESNTQIGVKKTGVSCFWYRGQLRVIDFDNMIIENYDRDAHGKRGSLIEIREDKTR